MCQATEHLEESCINTIRMLAADAVQKAKSGHPGMPMGAAAMAFVLWTRFLKHNPGNPAWPDRDRFVLSAGHGSMLLYALLHLTGYYAEKLATMEQICEGLAFAHARDLVHRDLKPANIHVLPGGKVKIMDFGLARTAGSDMTSTGTVMGTPHYMSPEQVKGLKADARSDVFALGCVFYELLSGRKPFDAESMHGVLFKVMQDEPASLAEVAPDVPHALVHVVERALVKDPAERFQSAGELLAGLRLARAAGAGRPHERSEPERASAATSQAAQAPARAGVNERINFSAALSYDPDGNVTRYLIDFGDGNSTGWTTKAAIGYYYTSPGAYNAWVPPHKKTVPVSDGKHRLAMLRLAIELNPHFVAYDRELVRQGVSYTVDTLREMRKEDGSKELVLLIGADNLAIFGEWREPDEIARLATVVVMRRPGHVLTPTDSLAPVTFREVEVPLIQISSTAIRARVKRGESIRYLVPEPVYRYIDAHNLYR